MHRDYLKQKRKRKAFGGAAVVNQTPICDIYCGNIWPHALASASTSWIDGSCPRKNDSCKYYADSFDLWFTLVSSKTLYFWVIHRISLVSMFTFLYVSIPLDLHHYPLFVFILSSSCHELPLLEVTIYLFFFHFIFRHMGEKDQIRNDESESDAWDIN